MAASADADAIEALADSAPQSAVAPVTSSARTSRPTPAPRLQPADRLTHTPAIAVAAAPPSPPKDVWTRIRQGFALAPMDNDLVREWENWYSSRPDYVARMIDRSSRFLFHIVEEVEKRNMPMEIALLPMIESAYNPVAYSRSHASGIWQFIPSTGKNFGLRQNWWYDGRRDVIAATGAALDYLEKLYGMFGDWPLALASYNWGEGAVGRAMDRNRVKGLPTDYESLTVPAETRGYLPKLIAVKNIISNPARYGLQLADVPNEPYFETIVVKQHIDLKIAAKFAELPLDEFKFLNPGHNKPVIRAGEAERIVLPKHKVATFLANFAKHDTPLLSWQAVTLRAGEKVEKVAALHGMTLAELKQVNGLGHQKKILIGQPLLVPLKGGGADAYLPDLPATPVALPKAIEAAKQAAASRRYVHQGRGTGAVQKAAQRTTAQKGSKYPDRQLRAENGKRVKVVASKTPASKKSTTARAAQRPKLASR
ncbi:MAG TPA: transglycosylase SLT domain-containing protein [Burkholderiales bacterium]|nr:transglycosylase SLT domain-containing protein [Burkholderiales bacterium]